jgi:hypothetical protein
MSIEISNRDAERLLMYLGAAAERYDASPAQRDKCRAWCIRMISDKIRNKLDKSHNKDGQRERCGGNSEHPQDKEGLGTPSAMLLRAVVQPAAPAAPG